MFGTSQSRDTCVGRLHVFGVATLSIVVLGLGLAAWALRPSSSGFSAVPDNLALYVTKAPAALGFTETMAPAGDGGAVLTLRGDLEITDVGPEQGRFTVIIDNLGEGKLCTPARVSRQHAFAHAKFPGFDGQPPYTLGPGHVLTGVTGPGRFEVRLCWSAHGPVARNGAYLSARFPAVSVFARQEGLGVTRQLNAGALDAADYAVQSHQQPTSVSEGG